LLDPFPSKKKGRGEEIMGAKRRKWKRFLYYRGADERKGKNRPARVRRSKHCRDCRRRGNVLR